MSVTLQVLDIIRMWWQETINTFLQVTFENFYRRILPQAHILLSVRHHCFRHAPQWPCAVQKWFSWDHYWQDWSKLGSWIVGLVTKWQLTIVCWCRLVASRATDACGMKVEWIKDVFVYWPLMWFDSWCIWRTLFLYKTKICIISFT